MEIADIYGDTRERMVALGRSFDADQADGGCPATPDWSVKDVFAHQAGVAADLLDGRLDGVATEPWTAAQVATRADRSLPEVLDEWDELGPRVQEAIRPLGNTMDPRLIIDIWTHEQDVRQAVAQPGGRDSAAARFALDPLVQAFSARISRRGLAPLTLVLDTGEHPVGGESSVGTVTVTRFEFLRAALGRRSPAQMRAWAWSVEPDEYVAALPTFGPRSDDLAEG